jgi:hypothetical protein
MTQFKNLDPKVFDLSQDIKNAITAVHYITTHELFEFLDPSIKQDINEAVDLLIFDNNQATY